MGIVRGVAAVLACLMANAPAMAATWVLQIDAYATGQQFVANCDGSTTACTFTQPWSEVFTTSVTVSDTSFAQGPVAVGGGDPRASGQFLGTINYTPGALFGTDFSFYRESPNLRFCSQICFGSYEQLSARTFAVNFVTSIGGPGPVPEPATWAMLLAGFFGIGSAMRSRQFATLASVNR